MPIARPHHAWHVATLATLLLAMACYLSAATTGTVVFGVLGVLFELGFWASVLRSRRRD